MSAPTSIKPIEVSRLTPTDWAEYKAIRLEALQREPAAFASTYAQAVIQPDEYWQQRLENPHCANFVARAMEQPIGLVGACLAEDDAHAGWITSMYVRGAVRRQGIGRSLLIAAIDYLAASPGIIVMRLHVSPGQIAAQRLYAALGFHLQGKEEPPGEDSRLIMERPVRVG